ncbi:hypothetical protein PO909_025524 [Leuciscus waleckii]
MTQSLPTPSDSPPSTTYQRILNVSQQEMLAGVRWSVEGLKRHNITPSAGPPWPGYNAPPPPSTSVSTPLSPHFLPNHPIIGRLSLVNVPSHSADEVRPELAAGGGVGRRMERGLVWPRDEKQSAH